MNEKKTKLVYSTDPNIREKIKNNRRGKKIPQVDNVPPEKQVIKILLQTKGRRGKKVTLIKGFKHDPKKLTNLARELKQFCGTGGTVKEQEIEIQGDKRKQVAEKLINLGYLV
jgi:translation initiation factor 1